MRRSPITALAALFLVVAAACGETSSVTTTDAATSASPATTATSPAVTTLPPPDSTAPEASTTAAPSTPTGTTTSIRGPGATIATVAATTQELLDQRWEETPDKPEGVLGAIEIVCGDGSRVVGKGDVFACAGLPRTEPDFQLDPVGMIFLVLDDHGAVSLSWGTDIPDATDALLSLYDQTPHGLFCRDLDEESSGAGFFSTSGGTPAGNYFRAVLYWFLEGMPDRMDADVNGIPCETLFDEDTVAELWNGGPLG